MDIAEGYTVHSRYTAADFEGLHPDALLEITEGKRRGVYRLRGAFAGHLLLYGINGGDNLQVFYHELGTAPVRVFEPVLVLHPGMRESAAAGRRAGARH